MVNLFAPINSLEDAERMVPLGADELYCGVIPEEWLDEYRDVKPPNRRANEYSQVGSLSELERIADYCDEHGAELHLTLNSHFYSERQAELLTDLVRELDGWDGMSGYIVADVHYMEAISDVIDDTDIVVSTGATVFNPETAAFMHDLGADGIHLPRHLTVAEIEAIAASAPPDLDLYAFVLNRNCMNIDGNCNFLHNPPIEHEDAERVPCFQTFSQQPTHGGCDPQEARMFPDPRRAKNQACGVCSLYRFHRAGLKGVKVVGRGFPTERKANDVELLSRAREHLSEVDSEAEFKERVRSLTAEYEMRCDLDVCYYPTVIEG